MVEPGLPKNYHQQVGRRIAELRGKADITQAELAERLMLSKATIISMEMGVVGIRLDRAHVLAHIFGVTVNDLICEVRTIDELMAQVLA